ncbi:MAG: cytochrome C biosynthesis protein [Deltaproteobacteria bacterium CG_4_8_14_3_um_filter_51_11]|nr:cytochrome C biosynthesis protein [bacterium]OIP42766.1 MAG: cytochrome C biosynthesis protein [Desulfobacteraceae bacterium CG2_30_51_40]PIP46657.1 MAG: cytochrome C biosynthesis protein [Deltaproteobacteria bacterium CG23_combo_of_CG06-09_8_20_14_all_51_20]PIV98846.1 MAG: cytochrome C biosynthesis protein [Deltaproteobacteria bacterium CG17_big_fil_post_rev_8_21_14_2_50_51_6]PIX18710.1 MAG: cytochrome C biosynthesis protein [Deltaproteobacteria bacterium CG_4_8_14_3_um_filter_51_11]PIY227
MLDSFFLTVNEWMSGGLAIAAAGCFLWGIISVLFSPCHIASIPLVVAYVGGQQEALQPRDAVRYSVAFTSGLFITIAIVGVICALLGRMLGDVGNYWQILVGLVLVWVALGMLGVEKCSMSGSFLHRLNLKGVWGAFGLGLAYGVLSGSCTFGFIAPILALITLQKQVAIGILFIILFALGHCLPIVIAGSSTAAVKRLVENSKWQGASGWFRKAAGVVILVLAAYFIVNPFFTA